MNVALGQRDLGNGYTHRNVLHRVAVAILDDKFGEGVTEPDSLILSIREFDGRLLWSCRRVVFGSKWKVVREWEKWSKGNSDKGFGRYFLKNS